MFLSRRPRHDDERGWVLVWFAIMLVVLLSMAAFAVDTGLWNYDQTKEQRAADAAALAGSVYLPGNFAKAQTTALDVARVNGYVPDADTTIAVTQVTGQPNQLQVSITDTAQNLFGVLMGSPTTKIKKTGIATYDPPIAMGSPVNQIGNDPESAAAAGTDDYPNLWLNVAGPSSPKQNGDAYLATDCTGSPDNCSGGTNSDLTPSGYYYTVHSNIAGPLTIQGFDPGFAAVGDTCGSNDDHSNLSGAAALAPNFNSLFRVSDPATRYKPVTNANNASDPGLRFCTGDHNFDTTTQGPTTTYKVFGPASVPGEPSSAPATPVCTKSFPGFTGNGKNGNQASDLVTALTSRTTPSGAPDLFVKYFRQWYTLCSGINATAGSDYFVQVTTSNGNGHNRFALRGGLGTTPDYTANDVNIYASARMSIYANVGGGSTTRFHLARLLPGSPGRTLVLDLFDIGDASAAGSLQIIPPSDSNVSSFAGCTYTAPPGNSTGPPWGSATPISNCTITNVSSSNYNGQWIEVKVPIPAGYTCSINSAQGCWVLIAYSFPSSIADTTSWTAHIDGDPVRLVG
jgi:hypothetical protein